MVIVTGGLVSFLSLALLAWVGSCAVSELRWKSILEKGKERKAGFIPVPQTSILVCCDRKVPFFSPLLVADQESWI